jgi:hypothetical protein
VDQKLAFLPLAQAAVAEQQLVRREEVAKALLDLAVEGAAPIRLAAPLLVRVGTAVPDMSSWSVFRANYGNGSNFFSEHPSRRSAIIF